MTSHSAEKSFVVRMLALLALHGLLVLWLMHRIAVTSYCCDADYYVRASESLFRYGLFYEDHYAGYRSYFVPLVVGLLRWIAALFGEVTPRRTQAALAVAYVVVHAAVGLWALREAGWRRYACFGASVTFNPALLGMVIFPLQEAVAGILCAPLLIVLGCRRQAFDAVGIGVALSFFALCFIIRSSWLWVLLPVLLFLGMLAWERRRSLVPQPSISRMYLFAGVAFCAALLLPQMLIAWRKFGTWYPYPADAVASLQLRAGILMYRFSAVMADGTASAVITSTPFAAYADTGLGFYLSHPIDGLSLVLAHIWAGFNYESFTVYVPVDEARALTLSLLVSAGVNALGTLGLVDWWRSGEDRAMALLATSLVAGSCAYTALTAAEGRFGLWGFLALSMAAVRMLWREEGRRRAWQASPLVLVYVLAAIEINALLHGRQ